MAEENENMLTVNSFGSVPKDKTPSLVEGPNGTEKWWLNGKLHKEDGPAIEWANGDKEWWVNGRLHREDGPAKEYANGSRSWWLDGKLHREDGPAVEHASGDKEWRLNGQLHREDGPAVEWPDGTKSWWLNGKYHRENGPAIEFANGTKQWLVNGKLHRDDGPAFVYPDGSKEWFMNGKHHRVDGPAREYTNGTKQWWLNGFLHREDGPAIEWANGTKQWWFNGTHYSEENWKKEVAKLNSKITKQELNVIAWPNNFELPTDFTGILRYTDGTKLWFENGSMHREGGPAYEGAGGSKEWWLNGKCHREDGPACEYPNGNKEWYLNGEHYSESDWLTRTKNLPVNPVGDKVFSSGKDNVIHVRHYTQIPNKASCVVEWPDKTREWLKDGYLHREDGPAIERFDGSKEWWLNGFDYESEEAWKEAMSSKIIKTVKSDAKEVTKRIAVAKLTNLVTTMAVAGLRTPSKATSKRMVEFLSTDNGKALMGLLVGMSLPVIKEAVPSKYNTVLEDVAAEFRIQSETLVLTKLVDNIIPTVTKLVQIGSGEVVDPEMFRVDTTACLSEGTPTNKNFEEETKEKVPHLRLVKG